MEQGTAAARKAAAKKAAARKVAAKEAAARKAETAEAKAIRMIKLGQSAFDKGNYTLALAYFKWADKLNPSVITKRYIKIAQQKIEAGQ